MLDASFEALAFLTKLQLSSNNFNFNSTLDLIPPFIVIMNRALLSRIPYLLGALELLIVVEPTTVLINLVRVGQW